MYVFEKKPLVSYVAYEPYGIEYLKRFLQKYSFYESGFDHDLLICFKQFKNFETIKKWKKIINFKFIEFDDSGQENDFDIGSYFRIAKKFSDRQILFLDTHTRPNTNNWLKIFVNHYKKKSIVGATGSMSSLPSQFLNFFYDQHSKLQQLRWGLYHLLHVKLFPNPHIRTTAFFLAAKDLIELNYNTKKFVHKIQTNYFEAGRSSLSNKLQKKGFDLILVNSDNKSFKIDEWAKSETFCLGDQKKLVFIDNRTEEYSNASYEEKLKRTKFCWGKN